MSSVSLTKGGKVNLSKGVAEQGTLLTSLLIGLGWDAKPGEISGAEFDLDASAFLLTASGKVRSDADFIYWGHLASTDGSVRHTGDNLTGAGDGDDEVIQVDLAKVPAEIEKIAFAVTIYEGVARNQSFGAVDNSFIRAVNADTGQGSPSTSSTWMRPMRSSSGSASSSSAMANGSSPPTLPGSPGGWMACAGCMASTPDRSDQRECHYGHSVRLFGGGRGGLFSFPSRQYLQNDP